MSNNTANASPPDRPENADQISRRKFLVRLSVGLGALAAAIVSVPIVAYLLEPWLRLPTQVWRAVGAVDDFRLYEEALEIEDVEDLYNKVEPPENVEQLLANEIDLAIFPNPATSVATVSFSLEAGRNVSVNLFSVTGGMIGNVYEGISTAGKNTVRLNTAGYTPGVYFVELQIDNQVSYSKLIIQ